MHSKSGEPRAHESEAFMEPVKRHTALSDRCETTYGFYGWHVLADLHGLDAGVLDDVSRLRSLLETGVARSGATLIKTLDFKFEPSGVTMLMLLAESHVSIHTYPEEERAFFDAFTCGDTCNPESILRTFCDAFPCCTCRMTIVMRGEPRTPLLPTRRRDA